MTIATWNIERPTKNSIRIPQITKQLKELNADIVILTETNDCIELGEVYTVFHTSILKDTLHKEGERRVSIFSKYKCIGQLETYDSETSICVQLQTPLGNLAVYGTIIGVTGNRGGNFKEDLNKQLADFDCIAANNNLCIAGDLNMSFADNYYYTREGREQLNVSFEKNNLISLTQSIPNNIDHIILPKNLVSDKIDASHSWNNPPDKKLSDHMGVLVTLL